MTKSQKFGIGLTVVVMLISLFSGSINAAFAWAVVIYMQMQMHEREKHYHEVIGIAGSYEEASRQMWGGEPDPPQSEASKNTPLKRKHKIPEHLKVISGERK